MMSGSLTAEERQRNTVGLMKSFRFEKQGKNIKDWVQIREVTPVRNPFLLNFEILFSLLTNFSLK